MFALLIALATTTTQVPGQPLLPTPAAGVDAVVQASLTHFAVENVSPARQVLFLGTIGAPHRCVRTLEPGERAVWPWSRRGAQDLAFELVSVQPEGWTNTGALAVRELFGGARLGEVWIASGEAGAAGFALEDEGLVPLAPVGGFVPPGMIRAGGARMRDYTSGGSLPLIHVPVILPHEVVPTDTPPEIDEEPLPPV